MANTYHQTTFHLVFAVKNRNALIHKSFKNQLISFIAGVLRLNECFVREINCVADHIHLLIDIPPKYAVAKIVQVVKAKSSFWISNSGFISHKFEWQSGYGVFSVSKASIPTVTKYIKNQEEHHRNKSFIEEYKELLTERGIDFDPRYVFKAPD